MNRHDVPSPWQVGEYRCLVVHTITGQVVNELPLATSPRWLRQINDPGMWQVQVPLGDRRTLQVDKLRQLASPQLYSVAVCWGDTVCQAGPLQTYGVKDGTLTMAGVGLWGAFNRRVCVAGAWNPAAAPVTDEVADLTLTGSLADIAVQLVQFGVFQTYRNGGVRGADLPVDVPELTGGSNTRTYRGYDLATFGKRLKEITQDDGGPDVEFAPYLTGHGTLRWTMRVGHPYLVQPGSQVVWDYQASLQSVDVDVDGSQPATGVFVRGQGDKRNALVSYRADDTLLAQGWPMTDYVDTDHTSVTQRSTLDGWAAADLALHGRPVETWTGVVRADTRPTLGTYYPGVWCRYSLVGHPWIPDGDYTMRLLGMGDGPEPGQVRHVLAAQGGV